jgi:hypothetical protein
LSRSSTIRACPVIVSIIQSMAANTAMGIPKKIAERMEMTAFITILKNSRIALPPFTTASC